MARVAMVFTGGTISMGFDPVAGGNVPALDGAAILARTPGLETIADIVTVDRGLTPASHFTFEDVLEIGRAVQESLDEPSIDGVVVVQGTDTIEETSFAWDLVLSSAKPVVVTGAMRAPHEADFDGPANLRDAVTAAVSPELRDTGVVVTLAGTLEPADDVTKLHTTAFTTFGSPNAGPLGRVADGRVVSERARGPRRRLEPVPTSRRPRPPAHGGDRLGRVAAGCGRRGRGRRDRGRGDRSREHVARLAGRRRASDGRGRRGRAGVALPGRAGLDGVRVPGRRGDVGPRRRDPGRDAVRDQGPRGAGPGARRWYVARRAGWVARGPGRVGIASAGVA